MVCRYLTLSLLRQVHSLCTVNPEKTVGLPTGLHNDVGQIATLIAPVDNGKGKAKEQPNKDGSSTNRGGGLEMIPAINWKYHGQNPILALATTESQWLVQLSNLQ